jgi:hypothetical protein
VDGDGVTEACGAGFLHPRTTTKSRTGTSRMTRFSIAASPRGRCPSIVYHPAREVKVCGALFRPDTG